MNINVILLDVLEIPNSLRRLTLILFLELQMWLPIIQLKGAVIGLASSLFIALVK